MIEKKLTVTLISLAGKGGMHHYITQLAKTLSKEKKFVEKIHIAIPSHLSFNNPTITSHLKLTVGKNFKEVALNTLKPWKYLSIIKKLKQTNSDIYHFTAPHPWNWIISLFLNKKIIYTIHDPVAHSGEKIYLKIPEKIMRMIPHGYITHSTELKNKLPQNIQAKTYIVPHGQYNFFPSTTNHKEEENILFFGRIEKYKGLQFLLEAFSKIEKKHPEWSLTVAGEGSIDPYKEKINKINNIRLENRFIKDAEIESFFTKTSMVVLPYVDASQSGIPFIAYGFEKPVIATSTGALKTTIKHNETGLLVTPKNANELEEAIIKLIKNPDLRKEMGKKGNTFIKQTASSEIVAKKTIQAYKKTIKQ